MSTRWRKRSFTFQIQAGLEPPEPLLECSRRVGLLMKKFGRGGIVICKWKQTKNSCLLTQSSGLVPAGRGTRSFFVKSFMCNLERLKRFSIAGIKALKERPEEAAKRA